MHRTIFLFLLLLSLPATAQDIFGQRTSSAPGISQVEPDFLPVEEAYQLALEVSDDRHLRLYWEIADGYYLYQQRFAFQLEGVDGPIPMEVTLSPGIEHEDEYFGVTQVHYHFADVSLALQEAASSGRLTVTSQGCADAGLCYPPQKQRYDVDFAQATIAAAPGRGRPHTGPAVAAGGADAAAPQTAGPEQAGTLQLFYMLLLAFIGGTILNLMPCVFPVLSLKVFSFATGSEHDKHVHGWIYAAGVVISFVLVAAVLITLKAAGSAVGWGFQLQSTTFVSLLAYLFFAMGLSLSGLLELGSGLMGTGSNLANRGGYSGTFFTGVLATVVASPCTAPFMGTALGFAATQSTIVALLVFAALGAGMAAPMVMLSYSRKLRAAMPKPGAWMDTFKQLMAFPLYATAIWLLWVAGRQTGVNGMAILLVGMLALALGLLLLRYGKFGRIMAAGFIVVALAITNSSLLQSPPSAPGQTDTGETSVFSEVALQDLLNQGRPVFINVTADWCITCIANERAALSTREVQGALKEKGITYLRADWTNYDSAIADFLASHNRNGIPLYLVYDGRGGPPEILPQLLTPSIVLDALGRI